jgi:DNA polymerase-3 subunit beta
MPTATSALPCLTFNRKLMLVACKLAANCVAKADIKPILQHLKLSVSDNAATVSATNLEQSLAAVVPLVKADRDGECLISASDLVSTLQACSDEELSLECINGHAILRGMRKEIKFQTANVEEFPDVPMMTEDEVHIEVTSAGLLMALGRVGSDTEDSQNKNKVRFATNSIALDLVDEGLLTATATDSHGLSTQSTKYIVREKPENDGPWLVPTPAARMIEQILRGSEGIVLLALRQNEVVCSTNGVCFTSRLVEGRYPSWRKFVPKDKVDSVELTVKPLLDAIVLAALGSNDEGDGRRIALCVKPGQLTVQAAGGNLVLLDSSRVEMDIEYTGKPWEKHFRKNVILNWLRRLSDDMKVTMEMRDTSAIFRTKEEQPYLQICVSLFMPGEKT